MAAKPPITEPRLERRKLSDILPWDDNPRLHSDAQVGMLEKSLDAFGLGALPIIQAGTNKLIAGHGRLLALKRRMDPAADIPVLVMDLDDAESLGYAIADNRLQEISEWSNPLLRAAVAELDTGGFDMEAIGYTQDALAVLFGADAASGLSGADAAEAATLAARFGAPPFTVLDPNQVYWQNRMAAWLDLGCYSLWDARGADWNKRKDAWIAMGLKSDDGRAGNLTFAKSAQSTNVYELRNEMRTAHGGVDPTWEEILAEAEKRGIKVSEGTSIFDPVLCELLYSWFVPPGGSVLDPFAGGSVRGIVAAALGHPYTGIDLRAEQITANRAQWDAVAGRPLDLPDNIPDLTPVEQHGGFLVKRDDLYRVAGVPGGKVRTCWWLAQAALDSGSRGLITAGSRQSPQVNIVAHIARRLGLPCRVHVPSGNFTPELASAQACGAEVVQHKAGYNNVIIARAWEDAKASGWTEIPFGMGCTAAVGATASQVVNLPWGTFSRIVVPCGSGMSLAGILTGLKLAQQSVPVLAVQVGADPTGRLDKFAPSDWRGMVTLVKSTLDYHEHAPMTALGGLELDPVYEAKCLPALEEGDLLWVVGVRETVARGGSLDWPAPSWVVGDSLNALELAPGDYDFVMSCPPYGDLEVYSDDPHDLSNLDHESFMRAYRQIIKDACFMLKADRFAGWVVGDFRDKRGIYRNFVSETIRAFLDAGLELYNEAVLVIPLASLPIRAGRQFAASRKLGKGHQNVLVFVKGDAKKAVEAIGPVVVQNPFAAFAAALGARKE